MLTINAVACHSTDPLMITAAHDGTAKVWWLPPVKKYVHASQAEFGSILQLRVKYILFYL
jgi:hypothetical protein